MQIFTQREAYEQVVNKAEEKYQRARNEYKRAYAALLCSEAPGDQEALRNTFLEAHNGFVLQLRATNAINERFQGQCLPGLLGEIAEVYEELCGVASKCVSQIAEASSERDSEQARRYQAISKEALAVVPLTDLQVF